MAACAPRERISRRRVRVPWRLVASPHYRDAALAVYVKVAALGQRPEGCTARVEVLAEYLALSRSTVERALRQLSQPGPDGEAAEVTTVRRTLPGGTGTSALRTVRPVDPVAERWVWVPVAAAGALTPRQLRVYAAVAYAAATGHPVTLAEIGGLLRHSSGARAGQPLHDRSVARVLDDLERLGWITVNRRAGYRGRHTYQVHTRPMQAALTPDSGDGSGPDLGDGSLISKEDVRTDSLDDPAVAGGVRRRRDAGSGARGRVSLRGRQTIPRYTGPQLCVSPRVWDVLAPVRDLYAACSVFVQRRIAREIGAQLDTYATVERLRARLTARRARTHPEEIRDPGRWLLGAALPRWGCGLTDCETGVLWETGRACEVCADLASVRRGRRAARRSGGRAAPRKTSTQNLLRSSCADESLTSAQHLC